MAIKPNAKIVLEVNAINKKFNHEAVITDFSFSMSQGERLLLFAPSGAGKTTLLRILSGLLLADSGTYSYPSDIEPHIVFQEPRLFPYLTVDENIRLPLKSPHFASKPNALDILPDWYKLVGLDDCQKEFPHTLSGGMKRKVSLLRALITLPELLILDEPFQSLDKKSREIFVQSIFPNIPNLSVLFTSHDILDVEIIATSILLIKSPKLQNPIIIGAAEFVSSFTN
ncbi:MAG TPA: ATP-binding cassette domain-containing protein [Anaerolineaceae bacterium]|nr:ATP-binding cassette domain-containing protein [Anaerolineaceae bacterium]